MTAKEWLAQHPCGLDRNGYLRLDGELVELHQVLDRFAAEAAVHHRGTANTEKQQATTSARAARCRVPISSGEAAMAKEERGAS